MKSLEQLVLDVETCIRLKDAGFPQDDSYFVWVYEYLFDAWEWICIDRENYIEHHKDSCPRPKQVLAAPLIDEILEVLPKRIVFQNAEFELEIEFDKIGALQAYYIYHASWVYLMSWRLPLPALYLRLKKQGLI